MRLAQPGALAALLLVPLLIVFMVWVARQRRRDLRRFGNPDLMAKLTRTASLRRRNIKAVLVVLAFVAMIVGLARPQWGTRVEEVHRRGLDIVFAFDTSLSMTVEDVRPNRLVRARSAVVSMLERLDGDRVALVAFEGAAFLQCPLTHDHGAVRLFLDLLEPGFLPVPGTNIAEALHVAADAFPDESLNHQVIILITDGEDHEGGIEEQLEELERRGIRVYTVGVGTPSGELIRVDDGQGGWMVKRDPSGEPVLSRLDVNLLQKIAARTGGKFKLATRGQMELDEIFEHMASLERRELMSRKYARLHDRYVWFILLALIALIAEFVLADRRRGKEAWSGRFS